MDRLLPREAPEAAIPQAGGTSLWRSTTYTLLALLLVAGAWVRFNGQIAEIMPALSGPAGAIADQLGFSGRARGLLELGLLPVAVPAGEVASMGLSGADAASLSDALQRRRLRLVHLPVLDVSPVLEAGYLGHTIEVSAGGYTRVVRLSREPVTLTLPIGVAGTVSFRTEGGDPVSIAAITLSGPVRLPDLPSGQVLSVGVLAQ